MISVIDKYRNKDMESELVSAEILINDSKSLMKIVDLDVDIQVSPK